MLSIFTPPAHPTTVVSTRTVTKPVPLDDPPLSLPPVPRPSASHTTLPSFASSAPAAPKKRKRGPSAEHDGELPQAKAPSKKRGSSGAPKEKRVQRLRAETPVADVAVRNRSRTRERNTGSNRMGALEATIPVERWWRGAGPSDSSTQPGEPANAASDIGVASVSTKKHVQSIDIVRPKWRGYRAWFKNHSDPDDPFWKFGQDNIPSAELEYPANDATEVYALVDAFDHDDYQPLKDLFLTIDTIATSYMDDDDRALIGYTNPSLASLGDSTVRASPPPISKGHPHSPGRSPSTAPSSPSRCSPELPLYRRLVKARNSHDGPLFLQALASLNGYIRALRPKMQQHMRTKWTGIPPPVWKRVTEEGYQRGVGPRMNELGQYKQWTSGVYGELMQPFISDVVHRSNLGPGKIFVDLGSGVAHTLMQASLQSGCTSYGIELSPAAASVAKDHEREFNLRLEMWDLCCSDFKFIEGDMLDSKEVIEWISKADVILVNNFVFEELLNERLTCLFLDARDGTQIISLKCFLDRGFKITERTISSPQAILRVEERDWTAGAVSWSNTTGTYYVHTVDRSNLQAEEERLNAARSRSTRTRRQ
ncbi:Nucleosomal histone H3-Lys79 methylase [Ceratobasidium sp. 394]|nr:Nucleosomal histone H3-Lys79 methylase [Ceratobasidium sp. 394]KAG9101480.1 Nucleosomal histone H3-Lys79 methylase [Ceratobasidium sp. UAMH 11750]